MSQSVNAIRLGYRRKKLPAGAEARIERAATLRISPTKLKRLRETAELTQPWMVDATGAKRLNSIYQWEAGERAISGEYLLRWLYAVGLLSDEQVAQVTE